MSLEKGRRSERPPDPRVMGRVFREKQKTRGIHHWNVASSNQIQIQEGGPGDDVFMGKRRAPDAAGVSAEKR
jgi:hypothetical protein